MRKILYLGLFVFGTMFLNSCSTIDSNNANKTSANNTAPRSSPSPTPVAGITNANKPVMGDDVDFLAAASTAGLNEIGLSKLAQTKATSPEVRKFAAMMVSDHTKAGEELNTVGKKKDVKPATEMDSAHKSIMQKLQGLSGADFDKAYVDAMIDDHEDAVDLFRSQANSGKDPEIKALAAKTLPTLEGHLKMINEIKAKI
jgi:putative membrane protein